MFSIKRIFLLKNKTEAVTQCSIFIFGSRVWDIWTKSIAGGYSDIVGLGKDMSAIGI